MKKYFMTFLILSASLNASAVTCTLNVKDKNIGQEDTVTLKLIDENILPGLYQAELFDVSASFIMNDNDGQPEAVLTIANADADLATTSFDLNSAGKMQLVMFGHKSYTTLTCNK